MMVREVENLVQQCLAKQFDGQIGIHNNGDISEIVEECGEYLNTDEIQQLSDESI